MGNEKAQDRIGGLIVYEPRTATRYMGCVAELVVFTATGRFNVSLGQLAGSGSGDALIRVDAGGNPNAGRHFDTTVALPWWIDRATLNSLTGDERHALLSSLAHAVQVARPDAALTPDLRWALNVGVEREEHFRADGTAVRFLIGARVASGARRRSLGWDYMSGQYPSAMNAERSRAFARNNDRQWEIASVHRYCDWGDLPEIIDPPAATGGSESVPVVSEPPKIRLPPSAKAALAALAKIDNMARLNSRPERQRLSVWI